MGVAAGRQGTVSECSGPLEALWSPGNILAALVISRCAPKPCFKWEMGSGFVRGVSLPQGKEAKHSPAQPFQRGSSAAWHQGDVGHSRLQQTRSLQWNWRCRHRGQIGCSWAGNYPGKASWLLKHRTDPVPIPVQLEQQQQTSCVQPPRCLLEQRHA